MNSKYRALFWFWFILATLMTGSVLYFLIVIPDLLEKYPNLVLYYISLSLFIFPSFFENLFFDHTKTKLEEGAKDNLPFEEYIDLKRSYDLDINKKDIAFAKRYYSESDLHDFRYKNEKKTKNLNWESFCLIVMVLAFSCNLWIFYTVSKTATVYSLLIFINIVCAIWTCKYYAKPIINLYKFAMKVDELIEKQKLVEMGR